MGLLKKLLEIQTKVDHLRKDERGNNYEYVSGSRVLGSIRPLMNDLGLLLKQEVISIDNERMDYATRNNPNKSEILTKTMQKFTWIDVETGEREECFWGANGQNDWDKGFGSAVTYGERYFLLKFFHIPTDEDDVDKPNKSTTNASPKKPTLTADILLKMKAAIIAGDSDLVRSRLSNYDISEDYKKELNNLLS
jgi:hypothetical protein